MFAFDSVGTPVSVIASAFAKQSFLDCSSLRFLAMTPGGFPTYQSNKFRVLLQVQSSPGNSRVLEPFGEDKADGHQTKHATRMIIAMRDVINEYNNTKKLQPLPAEGFIFI